jgi:hypothetical protein
MGIVVFPSPPYKGALRVIWPVLEIEMVFTKDTMIYINVNSSSNSYWTGWQ